MQQAAINPSFSFIGWGRRRPFFLIGAIGCSISVPVPLVAALWMAVLLLWLLDAGDNPSMEPYRAFLTDEPPDDQLAKGFLTQSFFHRVRHHADRPGSV